MAAQAATPVADSAASPPGDRLSLFGLSGDTSAGNEWQGNRYTSSDCTFRKWRPTIYPGEWKMPNGMRYPFFCKLKSVTIVDAQAVEVWTWEWVETQGMPTIAQVEKMLRDHAEREAPRKKAAEAAKEASNVPPS